MIPLTERVKTFVPPRYLPGVRKLYWQIHDQKLYRSLRGLPYIGKKVYCPCCSGHFRRFIPYGISYGPNRNGRCPGCGYLDRHRMLWLYLHERTNLFRDKLSVLHFAPENIIQQKLRSSPNLDYTSADLDSPLAMVKVDITNIPFEEQTFDVVLCSHVLEHIPDDRRAMSELYRVLKPGGWALILVPFDAERAETFEDPNVVDPKERTRLFGQFDHVRLYGRDFVDRLERAGFAVHREFYPRELGPDLARRYGLLVEVDMFYCTKPT